ncbi:tetratricopeptide repeat protein [Parapedobacter koreensis]|uniref:Tetratricopeptide repeat-containing protein n=1 Tax=Parapedobacter koreensis TaxID=332977 RepID=A0A1H7J0L8_9SPHI|nr:hypothetical protein [Parapedobacter koreensis]SEK67407.1 hypothetical protein SAMN05421740_102402 [Parapedobacter koreensis]
MKLLLFVLIGLTIRNTETRGQSIEQLLTPKIATLETARGADNLQRLANDFERIALAHPKNWHAQYYTAYAYTVLAFQLPKGKIDATCDRAVEYLDKAVGIRPKEVENYVLMAYLLSARINVNPMFRGASMGSQSKEHLNKAFELAPDNPRAYYVRGMGIFRTPAAFGGGKKKARPYLDKAMETFNTLKDVSPLDPRWGKNETAQLLAEY